MIPILYESGFISIQTLWVFAVAGILVASYLAIERLKRARVNFTLLIQYSSFFLIWSLIGSRIVYFLSHTDAYLPGLDLRTIGNFFAIWDQGFSFWGASIAFVIAMIYKLRKSEANVWKWADALSVPFLVGVCVGLFGAFLAGYSYGTPTNLPWGILYESYNVKYTVPVHPVQLYEIFLIGILFMGKKHLSKKTSFFEKDGNTALYFGSLYFLLSFILEFLRGDDTLLILGIRVTHIGFLFFTLLCAYTLYKRLKPKHHGSPETL